MAIKITDNFQVNIKNPIDNRFVVGSQSIPGVIGTVYPTPFYAYRDDISSNIGFVYPGLRIWDFNENLPYVWTGTTWSNENLTGASVEGSGNPGGTGFENYVVKFKNNATVLTKSLLFDNYEHVGLGIITGINPNSSSGIPLQASLNLPASGLTQGLHVQGHIKTNSGFIGDGKYIGNINAGNINAGPGGTGRLALEYINTGGLITASTNPYNPYLLTTNGSNLTTSWQSLLSIIPHWEPTTLGLGNSGAVSLYSGENGSNQYEFFSLVSTGLDITDGTTGAGSVRIESKPAVNVGSGSASVYKGLNTNKIHEFKTISSNFMDITEVGDVIKLDSNITSSSLQVTANGPHGIKIEVPATFEGTDYYVNNNYTGAEQLGTRSKPFRELKYAINKILNRPTLGITPNTYDATINGGFAFKKWEIRTGPGQPKPTYLNGYATNLPGGGSVRVIIQSYSAIDENLAINNVTYYLENKNVSRINVFDTTTTYNDPGTPENGQPFEYIFDTTPLVTGAERGNPYYFYNGNILNPPANAGELDYEINVKIEGSGIISYSYQHLTRKGMVKHMGTNSKDYQVMNGLSGGILGNNQRGSYLTIGSIGGDILFEMYWLGTPGVIPPNTDPLTLPYVRPTAGKAGSHIASRIPLVNEDDVQITREGTEMYGFLSDSVPDYGVITVEGRNQMFNESVFMNGAIQINAHEQHMIYAKDYGSIYSDNGRIYMRRSYQKVIYSRIEYKITNGFNGTTMGEFFANSINVSNNGNWFRITEKGNVTNWHLMGQSGKWRTSAGVALVTPTLSSTVQVGWVFKSNGIAANNTTGKVGSCTKIYLPSEHIYDNYLKNGASLAYGGDFYTQQNTNMFHGAANSFICLENNIPYGVGGTTGYEKFTPAGAIWQNTFCGFAANGGGSIHGLIYNNFIKSILDSSYNNWQGNGVTMKSVKLDSWAYKELICVVSTTGATLANNYATSATAITGISNWTKTFTVGNFTGCYFNDYIYGGEYRIKFSNLIVANGGNVGGIMYVSGTTIDLGRGSMNSQIPYYTNDVNALAGNYPIGGIYRDPTGLLRTRIA